MPAPDWPHWDGIPRARPAADLFHEAGYSGAPCMQRAGVLLSSYCAEMALRPTLASCGLESYETFKSHHPLTCS